MPIYRPGSVDKPFSLGIGNLQTHIMQWHGCCDVYHVCVDDVIDIIGCRWWLRNGVGDIIIICMKEKEEEEERI